MKFLFGILLVTVFVIGFVSTVDAHPHITPEMMETHSHILGDKNYEDNFILHDFEHVIISTLDWINQGLFT